MESKASSTIVVALTFVLFFDSWLNSPGVVDTNSRRTTVAMLQVTHDAQQICREAVRNLSMLAYAKCNTKCLRLIESQDGVAMSFELPRGDDQLVRVQGGADLAVSEKIADAVSEMTLDVRNDGRFVLS